MKDLILVSRFEAKIRTTLRKFDFQTGKLFYAIRQKVVSFWEKVFPFRKEYYMDFEKNRIIVRWERKKKRQMGTWIMHNGRLVKVQESIYRIPMMVYGWRETDNGSWDDTFQCHVKDKNHYRQLLKEHNCRQKEDYKYCKSAKAAAQDRAKATRKQFEKAYAKTLKEMPVSMKEII